MRLAPKQIKKIAELVELQGVSRSTVLRMLIDIGLDSPEVSLLMRRPGAKGRTAVERVIRAVAAKERVKVTQSALLRAQSVKTEVNALRAEELAEAMAALIIIIIRSLPISVRPGRFYSWRLIRAICYARIVSLPAIGHIEAKRALTGDPRPANDFNGMSVSSLIVYHTVLRKTFNIDFPVWAWHVRAVGTIRPVSRSFSATVRLHTASPGPSRLSPLKLRSGGPFGVW